MEDPNKITYFAETDARNKRVKFGIKNIDRLRHVYSIGKTGMGKSTMLENMAIQDIQNGNGMAFLDPHGKTADLLLDYIPEERIKDVIYFAPFDTDYPISFNVMEDVGPDRRHLVVSGLMSAFEKIWVDAWSARMAYILQNSLAALLEYPGATMLGINRMLSDKVYRTKVVNNIQDPTTKSFWTEEFAKYTERFAAEATPAIQNKVGQFTSNPLIRNIIGQPKSSFDIRKIMDEKKILIVNLSKGLVGENNANLLGSMLVTKIYLAAMSRADVPEAELKKLPNFYLYVDEFQSFANKSFADILSEARKYKLSLNITHQYIEQMAEEVRAAVFGNVGTMISFRVGSYDAEVLEKEFAPVFTAEDMVNLGFVQIYLKLMIDGVASQPFSATTLPPIPKPDISFRNDVMENSRKTFANPKEEVEQRIKDWHADGQVQTSDRPPRPADNNRENRQESRPDSRQETRQDNRQEIKQENRGERREAPKENFRPKETNNINPEKTSRENIVTDKKIQIGTSSSTVSLGKAIEEAMKEKNGFKKDEEKLETKEVKKEEDKSQSVGTISLQILKHGEKNNNKGPSNENKNALKEAIEKAKSLEVKVESKNKGDEKEKESSSKFQAPNSKLAKEVPEEVLRKILSS